MIAERYREAGVDLDRAERAKRRIAELVRSTRTEHVRGRVGAFGGMVAMPSDVERPILVMSTDGVGTKLLVAIAAKRHAGLGEDLVNHSVNDILVHGARPIAFQDYIAVQHLDLDVVTALVEGLARGCRSHEMTLIGGETAQLPDLYLPHVYDLAGTILGVVDEREVVNGKRVARGDVIVGYASSGLHTNGYSLARSIILDRLRLDIDSELPELGATVADVLLQVHVSYERAVRPAIRAMHALAHVTGGGIPGNLIRVLPEGAQAVVDPGAWTEPAVFDVLRQAGKVQEAEMRQVFNLGLGMLAVVDPADVDRAQSAARAAGIESWVVGEIRRGPREVIFG